MNSTSEDTRRPVEVEQDDGRTRTPIIVDWGVQSEAECGELRRGKGELLGKMGDMVRALKRQGRVSVNAEVVVVVVREREANPINQWLNRHLW